MSVNVICTASNFAPCGKQVTPATNEMTIRTDRRVPRLGVMLVGWGGNNGTTVTGAVLANQLGLTWRTKTGVKVSDTGVSGHIQTGISNRFTFITVAWGKKTCIDFKLGVFEMVPKQFNHLAFLITNLILLMFIVWINYLKQLSAS